MNSFFNSDGEFLKNSCYDEVKKVECVITFRIDNTTQEEKIVVNVHGEENLSDAINREIDKHIQDLGIDALIDDGIDQHNYDFCFDGTIDIFELGTLLYSAATNYIEALDIQAVARAVCENDWSTPVEIDIKSVLKDLIESRSISEQWNCDVGGRIEHLLNSFCINGSWHVGFKTPDGIIDIKEADPDISFDESSGQWMKAQIVCTPIIWFGYDIPMTLWTIDENIDPQDYSFWFLTDYYNRVIPDFEDSDLETWYFWECGMSIPAISELMDKCPISFEPNDTQETIKQRINAYIFAAYHLNEPVGP